MTSFQLDNLFNVKGKVVLITGGSRGIGKMVRTAPSALTLRPPLHTRGHAPDGLPNDRRLRLGSSRTGPRYVAFHRPHVPVKNDASDTRPAAARCISQRAPPRTAQKRLASSMFSDLDHASRFPRTCRSSRRSIGSSRNSARARRCCTSSSITQVLRGARHSMIIP